jgi:hypothetical protein
MNEIAKKVSEALATLTGKEIDVRPFEGVGKLPRFLLHRYEYMEIEIGDACWLAMLLKTEGGEVRPAQLEKHIALLSHQRYDGVVFIAAEMPFYTRSRLVARGIAFVVPGVQVYWPELGVSENRQTRRHRLKKVDVLSPASQVVAVRILLKKETAPAHVLQLVEETGYSQMTVSRAYSELMATGAFDVERVGKFRMLFPPQDRRRAWEQVADFMRNPVRETVFVWESALETGQFFVAGESALAQWTLLDTPDVPVYAVSAATWREIQHNGVERIPIPDAGTCGIQVWRYDPSVLTENHSVDPFSLYLSFRDDSDERIQSALENMMENYPW